MVTSIRKIPLEYRGDQHLQTNRVDFAYGGEKKSHGREWASKKARRRP